MSATRSGSCADSDWHSNVQLNKCTRYVVYRLPFSEEPSVYDVNDDFATNKNILHLSHACQFKASTTTMLSVTKWHGLTRK